MIKLLSTFCLILLFLGKPVIHLANDEIKMLVFALTGLAVVYSMLIPRPEPPKLEPARSKE